MADLANVTLPSGVNYNFKDSSAARLNRGIEYIQGTWTSVTSNWTGVSADDVLYDEKKIVLFVPKGSTAPVTLNLTLSDGTNTGAKNVYLEGSTRLVSEYSDYDHVMLIYHDSLSLGSTTYSGWWVVPTKFRPATDDEYGSIKLNSQESITLTASGQLNVGGRLGQSSNSTGVYSPKSISPSSVGNGSFLLTEASGTTLGDKSLAVSTGTGITLASAATAGSTTYTVSNTYANRIICAGLVGGRLAVNESSSNFTVGVTSVTINGSSYTPSSASSSGLITIKTDATLNPNSSISSVRPYPREGGFSNLFVGQCVGTANGSPGASVVVGQKVSSTSGNACCLVGADIYNTGNGNAVFGRQHISRKNRSFLSGTGHDTSDAKSESVAALGEWSKITSTTLFAVGNGTSATDRNNAFEITSDGGFVLVSPGGSKYKIKVNDDGTLSSTKI